MTAATLPRTAVGAFEPLVTIRRCKAADDLPCRTCPRPWLATCWCGWRKDTAQHDEALLAVREHLATHVAPWAEVCS